MKLFINTRGLNKRIFVVMIIAEAMVSGVSAQSSTNKTERNYELTDEGTAMPTNVFITGYNHLLIYNPAYGQVFDANKVRDAANNIECGPVENDAEGHWGDSTNGFQLSLRLNQTNFEIGKPVLLTFFIRNTSHEVKFYNAPNGRGWPLPEMEIDITNGGRRIERLPRTNMIIFSGPPGTLIPHNQNKYDIDLSNFYDLSKAGTYDLQASFEKAKTAVVTINITNELSASPK